MPVLSSYVSTLCELLKIVQAPASSGEVYTAGTLDRQAGIVNPQMMFICPVRSHDWVRSGWPRLNVDVQTSFGVNLKQLQLNVKAQPSPPLSTQWNNRMCRRGRQAGRCCRYHRSHIVDKFILSFNVNSQSFDESYDCTLYRDGQEPIKFYITLKNVLFLSQF